jgi:hypothetical protein
MFDFSMKGKPQSPFSKLKDKEKGKKYDLESASTILPSSALEDPELGSLGNMGKASFLPTNKLCKSLLTQSNTSLGSLSSTSAALVYQGPGAELLTSSPSHSTGSQSLDDPWGRGSHGTSSLEAVPGQEEPSWLQGPVALKRRKGPDHLRGSQSRLPHPRALSEAVAAEKEQNPPIRLSHHHHHHHYQLLDQIELGHHGLVGEKGNPSLGSSPIIDPLGRCLSQGFYSCTNIMTKKQVGEERVYSAYISTLLFITERSQDRNSSRSGSRSCYRGHGGMFFTGLLSLLSYRTKTTSSEVAPLTRAVFPLITN